MVRQVNSMEEFKSALNEGKTCIVDFYATWCGPCKMVAPKLQEFSEKYPNILVLKVDVDVCDDIAQEYEISAMPTFIVIQGGKKAETLLGADPGKLEQLFKKYS